MLHAVVVLVSFLLLASGHKEKKIVQPRKSCPKGYSLENKQCISRRYEDPILYCNNGAELIGNTCLTSYSPQKSCPKGWTASGKLCTRTTSAPRQAVCYNGYVLEGDYCVAWTEVPLVPNCVNGELAGDVCVVQDVNDAQLVCPADADYDKEGCYTTETFECAPKKSTYGRWLGKRKHVRAAYYQPSYGKKGHYKAPTPRQTWCTRRVPASLIEICPVGWEKDGDVCVKTTVVQPDMVCPVPYASKGCKERAATNADFRCPAGFTDGGKSGCYATKTMDADWECSGNAQLQGDRCASYSAPATQCGNGLPDTKGKCLVIDTTDVVVSYGKY